MEKQTFENLISTMGTDARSLIQKMNVQNNAVIVNQTDHHNFQEFKYNGHQIKEYSFKEKGVGLSRNSALMRASGDICIVSDDDMVYVDQYQDIMRRAYEKFPDADMILFNIRIHDETGVKEKSDYTGKIHYLNSLKYGTATFTFKRQAIMKQRIAFSHLFGGGAKYSNGEDNLFLWDCLKAGLRVYAYGEVIADVYNDTSSWFEGYNEKLLKDRGALFEALSPRHSNFLIYQYALRSKRLFIENFTQKEAIALMKQGKENYKNA